MVNYPYMRRREWDYRGDGRVEIDYVCLRCETIVLVPQEGCQYCRRREVRDRERLAVFLTRKEGCDAEQSLPR